MLQSIAVVRSKGGRFSPRCQSTDVRYLSGFSRPAHFESRLRFIKQEVSEALKQKALNTDNPSISSSTSGCVFVGQTPQKGSNYSGVVIEASGSNNGVVSVSKGSFQDGLQNGWNTVITPERCTSGEYVMGAPTGFSRSLVPKEDDLWYLSDEILEEDKLLYKESLTAQPTARVVELFSNDSAMKDEKGYFGKVTTPESSYIGSVVDGTAAGSGMSVSTSGGQVFVGEFENGMPHGYGREQRRDVGTYEGRWEWGAWTVGRLQLNSKLLPTTATSVTTVRANETESADDVITYQGEFYRDVPHGVGLWRNEKAKAEWGGHMAEGEWCGSGAGVYRCPDLEYAGDRFLMSHKRGGQQAYGVIRTSSTDSSTKSPSRVMYEGCVAVALLEGGAAIDLRSDGAGVEYPADATRPQEVCCISHGESVVAQLDRTDPQIQNAVNLARKSEELARATFNLAKSRDDQVTQMMDGSPTARIHEFIESKRPKLEEFEKRLAAERVRHFGVPSSTPQLHQTQHPKSTHHFVIGHHSLPTTTTEQWIRNARSALQRVARFARSFNLKEGASPVGPPITSSATKEQSFAAGESIAPSSWIRPQFLFGNHEQHLTTLTKSDPTLAKLLSENSISIAHLLEYFYTLPNTLVIPRILHELSAEQKVGSEPVVVFLSEVLRSVGMTDDRFIDQLIRSTNAGLVNSALRLAASPEKPKSSAALWASFFASGNVSHLRELLHTGGDGTLGWYAYQHNAILEVCHNEIKRCEEKGEDAAVLEAQVIAAELARLLWRQPREQDATKCLRLLTSLSPAATSPTGNASKLA